VPRDDKDTFVPRTLPTLESQLRQRIVQLETLLRREQAARELAEQSAARAWRLGTWPRSRALDKRPSPDSG
jgi:uncharacterized protein (DUF2384 family)